MHNHNYELSNYNFVLPPELIAQNPPAQRGASRLLIIDGEKPLAHKSFSDLPQWLSAGDLLVFNNTQVIPARLSGQRISGGKVEILLLNRVAENPQKIAWQCMARPTKNLRVGEIINLSDNKSTVTVEEKLPNGQTIFSFAVNTENDFWALIEKIGKVPLPPYITRAPTENDASRYQTVYAKIRGAVAAPTAGLHFTDELLSTLKNRGVETTEITLHVGAGTFKPISVSDLREHQMDSEYYEISPTAAEIINRARAEKRRIIAVGTTSARTLESAVNERGEIIAGKNHTNLFIMPNYQRKIIDGMITNFHLPQSSLLVLIAALIGREKILSIYHTAIAEKYQFYSYGDAMLILL